MNKKTSGKMNSDAHRYHRVVEFIQSNLHSELSVEVLCSEFGLSKFHFHRQFAAHCGMNLMALVRHLRLKRAAYQLLFRSEMKVIDIALQCGYDSHEGFSRAFRKHFALSPAEFRDNVDWQVWQKKQDTITRMKEKCMSSKQAYQVEIVEFRGVKLAVLEHRDAPYRLGASIQRFIAWRKSHGLPPSRSRTFNLVYDDPRTTPPDEYRFDIACEYKGQVEVNNNGIINKCIPPGPCARLSVTGGEENLAAAVDYLYAEWLVESGYSLRDTPMFFERIRFFPDVAEHHAVTHVFLPLE